jgi:tetratricopeptide (TPR) repeat protein
VRAVELLNKLLAVNPDDAIAWFKKGNAMSGLGRSEDALDCYDKAIASAHRTNEVWRLRGGSTKAVVHAVPAERIEAEAWNSRGLILKAAGRYVDALHSYDAALEIDPRRADIWCNHGNALFALGRLPDALTSFDKAVGLAPRDKKSWCNRGVVLKALGRLGEAIKCYDTALQIDPKDVKTWLNRGNAFAALELYEDALESFREAQNLGDPAAAKYVEQCRELLKREV